MRSFSVPAIALVALSATAGAQPTGTVRGVVFDSIVGAPLAGAEVWIEGVARTAVTDRAGGFRIDSVAAGAHTITFGHAALDSLGLGAPYGRVAVKEGDTTYVMLSTPSMRGIARRLCPGDTAAAVGALLGVVRDAAAATTLANAHVDVRWSEFDVGNRTSTAHEHSIGATAGANGRYVVCGVPNDVVVGVQATVPGAVGAAPRTTGLALVDVRQRALTWHDVAFGVAPSAEAAGPGATLLLSLVDRNDRPVAGAQARVDPGDPFRTATDDGLLRLTGLPSGTSTLEVRAVGYVPTMVPIDLTAVREKSQVVRLEKSAIPLLETVRVIGKAHLSPEMAGYELRKRSGVGYFIERDQIERRQATRLTQVLRTVPGLHFERSSPTDVTVSSARTNLGALGGSCPMALVVDGHVVHVDASDTPVTTPSPLGPAARGGGGAITNSTAAAGRPADMSAARKQTIDDFVSPQMIDALEVYPSMSGAPLQYGVFPCGAILVWTRAVSR